MLQTLLVGLQNGTATLGKSESLLIKLYTLTKPSSIPLLGYLLKCIKTYIQTKTCTQMFTADLFILIPIWRCLRCLSTGKWINSGTPIQGTTIQQ